MKLAQTLFLISLIVSAAMWTIGNNDSKLTELRDLFWLPLPVAAVALVVLLKGSKK